MVSEKRKFGDFGESVASEFIDKRGFRVLERNYLRKWGEIDIVAIRNGIVHFIEVKSVKCDLSVTHETNDSFRAEDNVHEAKLRRLSRTIQSYLMEKNWEGEWQFDVVVVEIDLRNKKAKVRMLSDIVL